MQTLIFPSSTVFPTRVGMNRALTAALSVNFRVPHTRGDEPRPVLAIVCNIGCSPHAWG